MPKRGGSREWAGAAPTPSSPRLCAWAGSPEEVSCYWETGMAGCSWGSAADKRPLCAAAPEHPPPGQGPAAPSPRGDTDTRPWDTKQLPEANALLSLGVIEPKQPAAPLHSPFPIAPTAAPKPASSPCQGTHWAQAGEADPATAEQGDRQGHVPTGGSRSGRAGAGCPRMAGASLPEPQPRSSRTGSSCSPCAAWAAPALWGAVCMYFCIWGYIY